MKEIQASKPNVSSTSFLLPQFTQFGQMDGILKQCFQEGINHFTTWLMLQSEQKHLEVSFIVAATTHFISKVYRNFFCKN
jgi:hypothetical protein